MRHSPKMLLNGGLCTIPANIALCPECGGRLIAESNEWESSTGLPTIGGIYAWCKHETKVKHKFWQSDWQPVFNAIELWAGSVKN